MQEATATVNLPGKAPLANVGLTLGALTGAINRPSHLPGIVVLYGPSGLGKSTSATIDTVQLRAYYVQAKSSWTRKAVYQSILKSMGVDPAKTIYEMEEQVRRSLRPVAVRSSWTNATIWWPRALSKWCTIFTRAAARLFS